MKQTIIYGIIGIAFIGLIGFGFFNFSITNKLKNNHIAHLEERLDYIEEGNWVCIAKSCIDWVYGDDWIVENCRPNEEKDLICKIQEEMYSPLTMRKIQNNIYAPLSMINVSQYKSCINYDCITEVYVKKPMEVKDK